MARKFYDLVRMDDVEEWEKILGYERIITAKGWIDVTGKKGEARKKARKAGEKGIIPIFVATNIDAAKEGSWVENSIMEIRTRIDMQVVNIMAEKNVAAMITLDYIRSGHKALQNAAHAVRLLHKRRVPTLLASGARSEKDLRAPRDIAAVGKILGMSVPMALAAVSDNWRRVL